MILHGTDTMAYTASALSFMLEQLAKPVILTGSSAGSQGAHPHPFEGLQGGRGGLLCHDSHEL